MEELARACEISPARARQTLDALREQGFEIHVSPAAGVQLRQPMKLSAVLIERSLGTRRVGRNVICFDEVDSTNDVAMASARQANADGLAVLAESQRKGRGRLGRRWISPPGGNLLMSVLLLEPAASALCHEALTIAIGLAVAEGIDEACSFACKLKWPNDVLIDGAKVAGILVEMSTSGRAASRAIVLGIGINVNAHPPRQAVVRPAASLARQAEHPVERIEVARAVLRRLDEWVARLSRGQTRLLRDEWLQRCDMINQRIAVTCAARRYEGRVLDVSPLEGLILQQDTGQVVHLPAQSSSVAE